MQQPFLALVVAAAAFCGTSVSAQQWSSIGESPGMLDANNMAAVFDSARARVVMFDGYRTTEWDGARWLASYAANPQGTEPAMAYDPLRQRTVLLHNNGSTWEWDGSTWTLRISGPIPSPRPGVRLAWDGVNQKVLAFGGVVSGFPYYVNETWLFDGTTWTQPPVGSRPSPRQRASLTWDSQRQRVVLFGGSNSGGILGETWEWDGSNWLQFFPSTPPGPREGHRLSFDAVRNRTVMVGGNGPLDDQWEWDGADWTHIVVPVRPGARSGHGQVFDPTRGTTLVMCGVAASNQPRDTWEWNGTAWTNLTQAAAPGAIAGAATDMGRGRLAALAPRPGGNCEAWTWDGRVWTQIVRPVMPASRDSTAMGYDASRQRVVMFGGASYNQAFSDTWEWDGFSWLNRSGGPAPTVREGHAMAMNPLSGPAGMLMFGGRSFGLPRSDSWIWNGSTWTDVTPIAGSLPPARFGHAMAASSSGWVILFGGTDLITVFDDTWRWGGSSWIPISLATVPPARHRHSMATDGNGSTITMAGGVDAGGQELADSWTWSGNAWSPAPALLRAQRDLTLARDPLRDVPLAVGGQPASRVELEILTSSLAGTTAYGQGCGGAHGVPELRAGGRPYLGCTTFRLHIGEVPATALTAVLLDSNQASLPLGSGCTQLIATANPFQLGVANAARFCGFAVPIPNEPGFLGLSFFAQGAALDPAGALQNLAVLTGGLQLRLGQ